MIPRLRSLTVLACWILACGGGQERPAQSDSTTAPAGMEGMAAPGMQLPSMELLPAMRAHLDSLRLAAPDQVPGLVAGHRGLTEAMLEAMGRDMQAMNMPGDDGWRALVDSVAADLRALPELAGEPLLLRMRAHTGRMRRLLERHESMMKM